ncbi:hypothetical protein AAG906_022757 [Vitis piasezkii]
MYASKSRTRAMQLKEELTMIKKGNQTVQEYLHIVKALVDKISLIDHLIADDDLTLYILNGLGKREKPLAFEELHDLLVGHDAYLRRLETTTQQLVASANYSNRHPASSSDGQHSKANFNGQHKYTLKCQIYDELGHIAKHCPHHGAVLLKGACENDAFTLSGFLVQDSPKWLPMCMNGPQSMGGTSVLDIPLKK